MARLPSKYYLNITELIRLGQIVETDYPEEMDCNKYGEVIHRYRIRGYLDDIVTGIARQTENMREPEVNIRLLRSMVMCGELTTEQIVQRYEVSTRQARRYMRKLLAVKQGIERIFPWIAVSPSGVAG